HRESDRLRSNCIITSRNSKPALARLGGCPRPSRGACPTVKNECTYPSPVGASHCARCQMSKRCIIDGQRNIANRIAHVHYCIITFRNGEPGTWTRPLQT